MKAGFWLAILAAFGFSLKAIFVKLAYAAAPVEAVTLLALRMAFALPVFLWVGLHSSRGAPQLSRRDWARVVILGLLGYYGASIFDFVGLRYISAGLERLILFTYPTLVILIGVLFLGHAIGRREWVADPRYASNAGRVAHRPEMAAELGAIFATQPAAHWLSAFAEADIPSGPVNTVSQAMADPQLAARFVAHPELPGLPLIPFPAHLGQGMLSPEQMAPPPRAGQHSAALLHELGCDAADVQRLVSDRVVRLEDPPR